ncbi:hypothetical protein WA1_47535 [Scytonema hofmannii PCC 7110]|uniref:Uncharacterized protein n=1 Tax=Scytonema hofmannii PCC 7110 TaxID=128403 RepID=A0A139WXX0_9CYAN|nr:hypothetical protein [Scytonema hofmannii]KYC37276.1 hypothetical protein WA1_47535 [Scytonema hofmannii PCC 7110]
MNIHINIERLILDGVTVSHAQRPLLQAALEKELGRLLATGGLGAEFLAGGAVPSVSAGNIQITPDSNYTQMGQQIAQAVYRGIGS